MTWREMKITSSYRGFELPGVDCITQMPTSKLSENLFFCWQFILNNVLMHTDAQVKSMLKKTGLLHR